MERLQTWWVTALYMPIDGDSCMEIPGDCEVVKAADAQATIATLQAELEQVKEDRSIWIQAVGLASTCAANMQIDTSRPIEMMQEVCKQLTQRTAELARVRKKLGETKLYLQQERANRDSLVACVNRDVKTIKELRALILALPKVEGEITVSNGYVKDSTRCHALFGADEDAASYAALLRHRQGMEEGSRQWKMSSRAMNR